MTTRTTGVLGLGFIGLVVVATMTVWMRSGRAPARWQGAPDAIRPAEPDRLLGKVRLEDDPLRSFATRQEPPTYPVEAIRLGQTGVVVVEVILDATRRLDRVDVLEAPSALLSDAVKQAIARWKFRPSTEDGFKESVAGRRLRGAVTFYFFRKDGRYQVAGPKDAPNLWQLGPA